MSAAELQALVRSLRARAELLDESDWSPAAASTPAPESPGPAAASASLPERLASLAAVVQSCRLCPLGAQRLNPAFGVGSPAAKVMFIGEGPGFEEDRRGEPFVGKAGQLLDRMLAAIGLSRETVYIANVVKCHPMVDPSQPEKRGNDRPPSPEEMAACRGFLEEQIRLIRPRFLVALGATAAKCLLRTDVGIGRLRGRWVDLDGTPLLPMYHPAALLRDESLKRDAWEDMKELRRSLEAR